MLDELIERWAGGPVTSPGPGELRVLTPGGDPVEIRAETVTDGEATLRASWAPPADLSADEEALQDLAHAAMLMRSPLLRCEATADGVQLAMSLYLEGTSRQEFLTAAAEVGHAHWVLTASAAELVAERAAVERTRLQSGEMAEILEQVRHAQRELEERAVAPEPGAAAEPSTATQPSAAPARWVATHVVPHGGMPAWVTPDPSAAPAVLLTAGVALQVCEERNNWAHIVAANGWSGWVDGRRLLRR